MKKNDSSDILSDLKNKTATELQLQKWKVAVRSEVKKPRSAQPQFQWIHLAAASLFGILIGGAAVLQFSREISPLAPAHETRDQNYSSGDATIEYAFYKSE